MRTRFENGAHYAAHAPLGYRKDPEQVGHLLVDDETKWIIEKIFALAVHSAVYSAIHGDKADTQLRESHFCVHSHFKVIPTKPGKVALAVHGAGAAKITHILAAEQIPTPSWLNFQRYGSEHRFQTGSA